MYSLAEHTGCTSVQISWKEYILLVASYGQAIFFIRIEEYGSYREGVDTPVYLKVDGDYTI